MRLAGQIKPNNFDILSPTFEKDNPAYDNTYNYVGSDWFYQKAGIALDREPFGVDINRAAFIHDHRFSTTNSLKDYKAANKEFRNNIYKLFMAQDKKTLGRIVSIACWLGVSGFISKIDYFLCKKNKA